jgi:hypothetical protein
MQRMSDNDISTPLNVSSRQGLDQSFLALAWALVLIISDAFVVFVNSPVSRVIPLQFAHFMISSIHRSRFYQLLSHMLSKDTKVILVTERNATITRALSIDFA